MSRPLDQLRRYGDSLANAVSPTRSRVVAMRAIASVQRRPRRSALRVAAATAGFFAIANVAAASVADSAVPGDLFYGLDRAYERAADVVGLGGDRTDERLDEATVLVERSDLATAVELVSEAVPDHSVTAAVTALDQAGPDTELHSAVLSLIAVARDISQAARSGDHSELASARDDMRQLATAVADAARARNDQGAAPEDPGPPEDVTPPGQGGTPPGQDNQPPGQSGTVPGNTAPGDTAPGNDGTSPGNTAPGKSGDIPGDTSPDQGGTQPAGSGPPDHPGKSSGRP